MYKTRRDFLKTSSLALGGTLLLPHDLFAASKRKEILGIQLYSVRDDMKKDPAGTLKLLSAMGYRYVEHANYIDRKFYGYTASEFKKRLDGLGMKMLSGHTVFNKNHWDATKKEFTDTWKYTVEDAATAGQQFVISPWLDESYRKNADDLKRYMQVFNQCGELCKKSGMKFGYHNHDFEFNQHLGGMRVYDIILQYTDPALVAQQLDTGNLYNGGATAMETVKKYPGRFELMHVKDEIKSENGNEKFESTVLGKGIVNVKEVIDFGRKSGGTTHFIIEQEAYQGKSPLDCAREDFSVMKKWGYA
ncbi:Sugar phosphate isomerase/epimerase [Hydrobacter penzbergensis]|jgi:sugar phosphate isomerase/epimerase|uniref:Sugar phosphate isomerase/epimerase n=1 Tax=Hydrobacter penzbergensis TaxID=1235997 RepID=A0A8X8IEB5_9BACT|nr:TIM barrel protein [Hydrobacter penzbergensis]SDW54399.1 Sugar phosphate isomerase/epimerase [Hydrobacter penzbergensis]